VPRASVRRFLSMQTADFGHGPLNWAMGRATIRRSNPRVITQNSMGASPASARASGDGPSAAVAHEAFERRRDPRRRANARSGGVNAARAAHITRGRLRS